VKGYSAPVRGALPRRNYAAALRWEPCETPPKKQRKGLGGRPILCWIISSETTHNVRVFYPTSLCPSLPAISRKHDLFLKVMVECFAPAKPCASGSILARFTSCAIPEKFSLLAEDYTGWQTLLLSRIQSGDGPILLKAIKATFDHRGTGIEARPVGLEDEFANDRTKSTQWTAFVRRSRLTSAPARLHETILAVREFAGLPLSAGATGGAFNHTLQGGGPWSI
jgi:hypothetical protein